MGYLKMNKLLVLDLDLIKYKMDKNATITIERNKSEDTISIVTNATVLVVSEYSDTVSYNYELYTMPDAYNKIKQLIKDLL